MNVTTLISDYTNQSHLVPDHEGKNNLGSRGCSAAAAVRKLSFVRRSTPFTNVASNEEAC